MPTEKVTCSVDSCQRIANESGGGRGLCSRHYWRLRKYGSATHPIRQPGWDRGTVFTFYTSNRPEDGCWEWRGPIGSFGYGYMSSNKVKEQAHRVSYELHKGLIPSGMLVRHKCDNPPCVNPDHLELGTHQDNSDDKHSRGRANTLRGSGSVRSRLDEEQVSLIRSIYSQGRYTRSQLGQIFGVAKPTIVDVVTRATWRHVA